MSSDGTKPTPGFQLPQTPKPEETTVELKGAVRRYDGRTLRKSDRQRQFNPRVSERFLEDFAKAKDAEQERAGGTITQAYFLEFLLSLYLRAQGEEPRPFGLSETAYEAAQAIAGHMGWTLSAVIEDAIAARYKQFNFAAGHGTKPR
jgi:hypothetical protein